MKKQTMIEFRGGGGGPLNAHREDFKNIVV